MSHQATNWAIEQITGGPSPKATLWSIANYANENWCSWPSQSTIAKESEQSLDTVQRRVRDLEEEGFVRRIPLHFAGRKTVDFFILQPSPFFKAALADIEPLLPRGYVIAPHHVAASCGSAGQPETQQKPGESSPDATANAAANAAALLRQPMNLGTKEPEERDGCAREPLISREAFELAENYRKAMGVDPDDDRFSGLAYTAQIWITRGYDHLIALATASDIAKNHGHRPVSYHAKAVEQRCEAAKVKPVVTEQTHAATRPTDWRARQDQQHQAHAEFRAATHAAAERERDEGSGHLIQLVPNARRA